MTDPKTSPALEDARLICRGCSESHGGTWPEGHVATCRSDFTCDVCGEVKETVCPTSDWSFPKSSPLHRAAREI